MAASKSKAQKPERARKLVDLGERIGARLKTAADKSDESETTIARICLAFGLDHLEAAGFELQRLGKMKD